MMEPRRTLKSYLGCAEPISPPGPIELDDEDGGVAQPLGPSSQQPVGSQPLSSGAEEAVSRQAEGVVSSLADSEPGVADVEADRKEEEAVSEQIHDLVSALVDQRQRKRRRLKRKVSLASEATTNIDALSDISISSLLDEKDVPPGAVGVAEIVSSPDKAVIASDVKHEDPLGIPCETIV